MPRKAGVSGGLPNRAPWDAVIVGARPAGLSAGIYFARYRRRVLVLGPADGCWAYGQRNGDYLEFPRGLNARELQRRGQPQAARFGATFARTTVERLEPFEGEPAAHLKLIANGG